MTNVEAYTEMAPEPRSPILDQREKTHGDFPLTAHIAQTIKQIRAHYKPAMSSHHAEAWDAIAVKMARILSGTEHEPDHWADIAGYAELGREGCGK